MIDFFLEPDRLWHLAWLLPLLVLLQVYAQGRRAKAIRSVLGVQHFQKDGSAIGINVSPTRRVLRFVVLGLIATLCVCAYARPAWGNSLISVTGAGCDVMFLFDVSKSMLAEDLPPNRLAHAKLLVEEVTKRLTGDRFGIISFAGHAFMECPLTSDRVSFLQILNTISEKSIPVGGTNIESALSIASTHFDVAETENRTIVLITDGEEHVGKMENVLDSLRLQKIPLIVVGLGDPNIGSAIQLTNSRGEKRFITDKADNMVKTKLNEAGLRQLAVETKGVYIRSTVQAMGEKEIVARVKQLTPNAHDTVNKMLPVERWLWFMVPAFVLFLLFIGLHERATSVAKNMAYQRFLGETPILFFVGTLLFLWGMRAEASEESDSTLSAIGIYNLGVDEHLQNEKDSAIQSYLEALSKPHTSPELRANINNNLGVIRHEEAIERLEEAKSFSSAHLDEIDQAIESTDQSLSKLKESQDYYREALRLNPNQSIQNQARNVKKRSEAEGLKQTLEMTKKKLEELQKQLNEAQKNQQQNQKDQQDNQKTQQQKQQQNQKAQKSSQKAQDAAKEAGDSAEKLKNQKMKDAMDSIQKSLEKAQKAQSQNDQKSASEHLQKAAQEMQQIMPNPQEDKKSKDDKKGDKQADQAEKKSDSKDAESMQESKDSQTDEEKEKAKEAMRLQAAKEDIDNKAGEILLREMERDENALRNELLQRRSGPAKLRPVDKDW